MATRRPIPRPAPRSSDVTDRRLRVAIVVDPAVWFDREIVAGAAQFAREKGDWQLYVEEESPDRLPDLRSWHGHGIIASFKDRRVSREIAKSGLPIVGVGGASSVEAAAGIPFVSSDDEVIAALAADHLLDRGLKNFGYYGTVADDTTPWSHARGEAFAARVAKAGRECHRLTASRSSRHWSRVQADLRDWVASLPKPVGIMACDDVRARHVLEACRTLGCRVPHDVAVIGVDNDELICDLATPPLSSISQSTRRIGYEAARLIDRLIRESAGAAVRAVPHAAETRIAIQPVGVVARGSTDTLAVADPVIAMVIQRIRDQDTREVRVADLVAASGLPRWKLESRFKRLVGHTIHEDLVRSRLSAALVLVRTTDLPLRVIAPRSGFHSVPYMITMFKRHFGITPARLRRHEQANVVRADASADAEPRSSGVSRRAQGE